MRNQSQAKTGSRKSTKLKGVHDTRRGPCTPLLLYSGIEAEAAGCLLAL